MIEVWKNLDLEDLNGEIWKVVEEFEDYCVSNYGRVKSFKNWHGTDCRILRQYKNYYGYFCVELCGKNKFIHVLMFEGFKEKIPERCIVHHIDFTKDNFMDNFQLMTNEDHTGLHHKNKTVSEKTKKLMSEKKIGKCLGENHPMFGKHHSEKSKELMRESSIGKCHSEETKELMREKQKRGENHPNSILTEEKVIEIRIDLDEGLLTQVEISEKFGVSRATISHIKNRRIWKRIILKENENDKNCKD